METSKCAVQSHHSEHAKDSEGLDVDFLVGTLEARKV